MNAVSAQPEQARLISVRLHLEGGQVIPLELREDAPELLLIFQILASRGNDAVQPIEKFLQLPLENGKAACSFNSQQLVSVITEPPVIVQLEMPAPPVPERSSQYSTLQTAAAADGVSAAPAGNQTTVLHTPRYMMVDDFLSPDECAAMLAYAQSHEAEFESGTVEGHASPHRQNKVIMGFADTAHSRLLQNRLLTWLPLLLAGLELPAFPLRCVESQLTASNDGHFYRIHSDAGPKLADSRVLTCVYYFFRQPRPFSGGALRLYDELEQGGQRQATSKFRSFEPVSNRLLVFHSSAFHELMPIRCPSRQFADSRFAATNWLVSSPESIPEARFGWGQLHCGIVPPQFAN
jgi:Rps23 Pro-64 3,4-dihydroxylase Tpa1-like proline 4-hydroxylase